jgi:hypothetical protein
LSTPRFGSEVADELLGHHSKHGDVHLCDLTLILGDDPNLIEAQVVIEMRCVSQPPRQSVQRLGQKDIKPACLGG